MTRQSRSRSGASSGTRTRASGRAADAARTRRRAPPPEEALAAHEIQGNILAGFNKDHQVFLFLAMERDSQSVSAVKAWLRALAPQVSSLAEVALFNDLFRTLRARQGRDPHGLVATWLNIAFSERALAALTSEEEVRQFTDLAFAAGLADTSGQLGDPTDPTSPGHVDNWVVGGPDNQADILIIVASDSPQALAERVAEIKATLAHATDPRTQLTIGAAVRVVWEESGETLPAPLTGHEHFGFKDGVSQPGIRGLLRRSPDVYLTPRLIDPKEFPQTEPTKPEFSRPGQPLVWPGQFVFGYYRQDNKDPRVPPAGETGKMMQCPPWGRNGSYLVLRRLTQDVEAFRAFVRREAVRLGTRPGFEGITPTRLASLLVGRWPSGAPVMRAASADVKQLGADGFANNYFLFAGDAVPPPRLVASEYAGDAFPLSKADPDGATCPLAAHIRKVNPRDTVTEQGNTDDMLTRLVLRRGIPFGPRYPGELDDDTDHAAPLAPGQIASARGLIFVSYQTSIDNQFVFLQRDWANHPRNPNPGQEGGIDPIIGQNAADPRRRRHVDICGLGRSEPETLELPVEWVTPTGGGFFFSPSISAIQTVLGRDKDDGARIAPSARSTRRQ